MTPDPEGDLGKKLVTGLFVPALTMANTGLANDTGDDEERERSLGFTVGRAFSDLTRVPGSDYAYYATGAMGSFTIGVAAKIPRRRGARTFQPELMYTKFGSRFGSTDLTYEHIAMPLLFRRDYATGPVKPHVLLGPLVGFRLRSIARKSNLLYTYTYKLPAYLDSPLSWPVEVGVAGGAGFGIPIENVDLEVSVRLYHGAYPHQTPGGIGWYRQLSFQAGLFFR